MGALGTTGTITSNPYPIEIEKLYPNLIVHQEACPMWVPLVENNEMETEGADYFIQQNLHSLLSKDRQIDTIILGCTHYPLLINKIQKHLPSGITLISQGEIVAESLVDYLHRHPEMEGQCSKGGTIKFLTTDSTANFDKAATLFFGSEVQSEHFGL